VPKKLSKKTLKSFARIKKSFTFAPALRKSESSQRDFGIIFIKKVK
jgi:hypothetical protein